MPDLPGRRVSLLATHGLSLGYGGAQVLCDVDLSIAAGEIVTVVGPNGSGKSSLLRALVGALTPASGRIERTPGLRVGYVPQALHVERAMPLTVRRFLNVPRRHPRAAVAAALAEVGLEERAGEALGALSGGQLRRAMLARALLGEPSLLLLDEPTAGLDQPGIAAFYELIASLRDRTGCAVLLVSHDLHVVMSASDRVICLNGHVCCEGAPNVVAEAPAYRALFGQGTRGALALYQHAHDHHHHHDGA